jgi:DNA-binding GntR family transcriptional regulator
MKPVLAERESLAEMVYGSIRDAIIFGELTPNSLHSVHELATLLNVSRTPVREALIKLADQGMVRFERNRGFRILQTTIHDLEEIFSLRMLLEVPATYRAAEQFAAADLRELRQSLDKLETVAAGDTTRDHLEHDAQFHRVIMRAAGNERLTNFIDSLRDLQMARGVSTVGITRELSDVYNDHLAIYQKISEGDARGAAVAMQDHIMLAARLLLKQQVGDAEVPPALDWAWMDPTRRL